MSIASPFTATDLATALRASTHGDVVTPDEPCFPAAIFGFRQAAAQQPEMVVIAADAADVAVTVRLAGRSGRRVAVQTAGRPAGTAGGGAGGGTILIVTRLLAGVSIDPEARSATVGAGSSWRQVLDAAEPFGLAAVSGPTPGVGAVGRTPGGRLGPVARTFGFAAEHARSFEVVTPAGDLVRVDAQTDPVFFQELRGGGASGLVTAMTIDLVPADRLYAGGVWFGAADGPTVLRRWREWLTDLPETASTSIARFHLPDAAGVPAPLRGQSVVQVRFNHVGDPVSGARLLSAIRAAATPVLDGVRSPSTTWSVDADPTVSVVDRPAGDPGRLRSATAMATAGSPVRYSAWSRAASPCLLQGAAHGHGPDRHDGTDVSALPDPWPR